MMITENDINNAAKDYCNTRYPASQDAPFIAEGFRQGATWAVRQMPNKEAIKIYMLALSSVGAMGCNSLDGVYAFSTEEERDEFVKDIDGNMYDISYFEDEIEINI